MKSKNLYCLGFSPALQQPLSKQEYIRAKILAHALDEKLGVIAQGKTYMQLRISVCTSERR